MELGPPVMTRIEYNIQNIESRGIYFSLDVRLAFTAADEKDYDSDPSTVHWFSASS